jgi:hypothetical protein
MYMTSDRRIKPRVVCDYPIIVQGVDLNGGKYKQDARLANLSSGGLYMWVDREFEIGTRLSVTVCLTSAPLDEGTPQLATHGIVLRTEPEHGGTFGVAVKFDQYRFQ